MTQMTCKEYRKIHQDFRGWLSGVEGVGLRGMLACVEGATVMGPVYLTDLKSAAASAYQESCYDKFTAAK